MQVFYYRRYRFGAIPPIIEKSPINFNELTFVMKGHLDYIINGKKISVKENSCIFVKNGSIRERKKMGTCDYVSFNFTTPLPKDFPTLISDCVSTEIKMIISLCDDIIRKYLSWSNKVSDALKLIVDLIDEKLYTEKEHPIIIGIKRFINDNLSAKISLKVISNVVGYSPNYCDSLFKKHAETSILNYVIEQRIEKAKLLLQEGILSLSEIALFVGFEDYNYFCRTFKKRTKSTPTEYKNLITTI